MKLFAFVSEREGIDNIVVPEQFLQPIEIVERLMTRGPLMYKIYNGDKELYVVAREYTEQQCINLPKEYLEFLNLTTDGGVVDIVRYTNRVPVVKMIKILPLTTGFYRIKDVRSLLERKLLTTPTINKGVGINLTEGNITCDVVINEVYDNSGSIGFGLVSPDIDVELEFSPNDDLLNEFNKEELDKDKYDRVKEFEEIIEMRKRGVTLFGLPMEFYEYLKTRPKTPEDVWSNRGKGRSLL